MAFSMEQCGVIFDICLAESPCMLQTPLLPQIRELIPMHAPCDEGHQLPQEVLAALC